MNEPATAPATPADLIPLIDMEVWRKGNPGERYRTAQEVDSALAHVGFLILTNHGIPSDLIDKVRHVSNEAFALPAETKLKYRQSNGTGGPGWTPIGAEANSYASGQAAPPDLKETWTVAPFGEGAVVPTSRGVVAVRNEFPVEVPSFKPAMERYIAAGLDLSTELFELLAVAAGLPSDTFAKQCTNPLHNFNLTWYPPIGDDMADPEPGQFRIGPHSDFGTITILQREASDPPLQVQRADGSWIDLPHVPDALVVNTGDQLAYWSGGRWRSNPHRIPAPTGEAVRQGRLSLVLFLETDLDAMLQPIGRPDDEPMDAVQYLVDKLIAIDTSLHSNEESTAEDNVPGHHS